MFDSELRPSNRRILGRVLSSSVLLFLVSVLSPDAVASQAMGVNSGADVTLSIGTPEEVGMSSAVLKGGVQLYQDAIDAGEVVGAVLLVVKDGKIVKQSGLSDMMTFFLQLGLVDLPGAGNSSTDAPAS